MRNTTINRSSVKKNSRAYLALGIPQTAILNYNIDQIMDAITNEVPQPVSVELYNNPRQPESTVLYLKVIGFNGTLYPLVNRNNIVKNGRNGEVSINTVVERIKGGHKLFTPTVS